MFSLGVKDILRMKLEFPMHFKELITDSRYRLKEEIMLKIETIK